MRAAEIFEQAQTLAAAFFGVKLSREDIVAGDNGGEIDSVVANAGDKIVAAVAGFDRVGMDEIKPRPVFHPGEKRMRLRLPSLAPTEMRDFARRARQAREPSGENAQADGIRAAFLARFEKRLHTNANTEKRLFARGAADGVFQAAAANLAQAGIKSAVAGQDDFSRPLDFDRARDNRPRLTRRDFGQRFFDRMQIAHAAIDDGDIDAAAAHKTPLVDGTPPPPRAAAAASASAKALKSDSIW